MVRPRESNTPLSKSTPGQGGPVCRDNLTSEARDAFADSECGRARGSTIATLPRDHALSIGRVASCVHRARADRNAQNWTFALASTSCAEEIVERWDKSKCT